MASRLMVLPLVAAVAAGVAYALTRMRGSRARGTAGGGTDEFNCQCGAPYRVTGSGRHRVYWPAGASQREPLLSDRCPSCGRELTVEAAA